MGNIIRKDSISLWRRRVAKKRQRHVINILRSRADDAEEKLARAYEIAANVLEKLAEKD